MTRADHLLWILAEECAEVAQRASKAARFGLSEVQPGQEKTNAERIMEEYADLYAVVEMLINERLVPFERIKLFQGMEAKKAKVEKFLAYSQKCGTLS
jgi:NTP pyrophosphatase (non-canonical NTP hydrolase)